MITRQVGDSLQLRCVSLKQPYAHFIFDLPPEHRKDVENRSRSITSEMGPILIAASQKTTLKYFEEACEAALRRGVPESLLPKYQDLELGILYGAVRLTRVLPSVSLEDQLWKWKLPGHVGYVLEGAVRLPPRRLLGAQTIYYVDLSPQEQKLLRRAGLLP